VGGGIDALAAGEIGAGDALRGAQQIVDVTLKNDVAAAGAGLGADFDDVIGRADHRLVVLDDDHGVAGVGERADDADEPVDVARMQADARLVEDEERVDERRAEAGGEVDALHFAAGERARGAVEGEVAEADLLQVAEAGQHRFVGEVGAVPSIFPIFPILGFSIGAAAQQFADGEGVELGERAALPAPAERLGLEARAAAVGAGIVGAVAGEKHPHMHLVGVLFEPAEEALHAVPVLGPRLAVLLAVAGFAVDDERPLLRRERGERDVGRDFFSAGRRTSGRPWNRSRLRPPSI
jgi:hypothetical protein